MLQSILNMQHLPHKLCSTALWEAAGPKARDCHKRRRGFSPATLAGACASQPIHANIASAHEHRAHSMRRRPEATPVPFLSTSQQPNNFPSLQNWVMHAERMHNPAKLFANSQEQEEYNRCVPATPSIYMATHGYTWYMMAAGWAVSS